MIRCLSRKGPSLLRLPLFCILDQVEILAVTVNRQPKPFGGKGPECVFGLFAIVNRLMNLVELNDEVD